MSNEEIKDNDMFQCKMYITDLETGKDSKEIDISDLVFNDWIEFEFGNYEDEDYGQLPYKDFKFFINDYSVTFYSPQYQKALQEIERLNKEKDDLDDYNRHLHNENKRLNNIINELEKDLEEEKEKKVKIGEAQGIFIDKNLSERLDHQLGIINYVLDKLKELKEGK